MMSPRNLYIWKTFRDIMISSSFSDKVGFLSEKKMKHLVNLQKQFCMEPLTIPTFDLINMMACKQTMRAMYPAKKWISNTHIQENNDQSTQYRKRSCCNRVMQSPYIHTFAAGSMAAQCTCCKYGLIQQYGTHPTISVYRPCQSIPVL